ncbi:P-loop NTPase fold protein [Neptunicella marina]|uniref:Kinase n=1 Tax=Neptunicella marina TaxID=2125989 RepID=A0A8J6LYL1_9ALTE|nr:P-loop NTPase fold protein [Neptunicella marina]MBC3766224.1 kinase [Neptunicella marina]
MLEEFITKHRLDDRFTTIANQWYIPLAEQLLVHQSSANKPFYVGINGCQGSGKSTLADFLSEYLHQQHQLRVVVLSLDDFYLSRQQRAQLGMNIHPLLQTRGVPGTHDVQLIKSVLEQLHGSHSEIAIPRFNKANDNPLSSAYWPVVKTPVDMVIFEGWSWGVMAQSADQLNQAVNSLEAEQDQRKIWRQYVNQQLMVHYQPLYEQMDYWLMLQAPSFDHVFQWRLEQEKKLALSATGEKRHIMSTQQICDFIQHFQRLTQHALNTLPARCDQVFKLDKDRNIVSVTTRDAYA